MLVSHVHTKRSLIYNIITPSPISPKTFKALLTNRINEYWQSKWTDDRSEDKFRPTIVRYETEHRKIRREEIVLARLRTRLTLITHILPWLNGRDPRYEMCDHCGEKLDIKHILIDCRMYVNNRREMINHFTNNGINLTVFNLLRDDTDSIEILIRYFKIYLIDNKSLDY